MLINRIAQNYLNQSNTNYQKKPYKQSTDIIVSSDSFRQISFGSIQQKHITSASKFKREPLAKKTYRILTGKDVLFVNVGENSKLGKEPVFCYSYSGKEKTIRKEYAEEFGIDKNYKAKWLDEMCEMKEWENAAKRFDDMHEIKKEEHFYSFVPSYSTLYDRLYYAVYYKDTGKWDNNHGKGYEIEPLKVVNKAISFDKKEHNQSLLRIIRSGSTKGKVVVSDTLSEFLRNLPKSNEPVIAVVGDFFARGKGDSLGYIPPNVKSVIFTKTAKATLDHEAAFVGSQVDTSVMLYDEKKIRALQKMAGKFINLDISQSGIRWKYIKPISIDSQNAIRAEIKIPEIVTSDRLLKSEEYKPELVGSKAYNLRRLEEMKNSGRLKDVAIPHSFAIPCGIYDKVLAANPEKAIDIDRIIKEINEMSDSTAINKRLSDLRDVIYNYYGSESAIKIPEETQQEITDFKDRLGLGKFVMVRSSFNGEDAKGYSAAGLYDSNLYYDEAFWFKSIFDTIKSVWRSKWNYRAYLSRRGNNIDHTLIKPTVIIQDFVDADYGFTIYTKDPESNKGNRFLIQMWSKKAFDPYIIRYDRDKKEVKIEQIARKSRNIILDDKFRVISADPMGDPIINNLEQWKLLLRKVCNAADEIEKEFGGAQDIEGGIKLGNESDIGKSQIYFWQTRDQIF